MKGTLENDNLSLDIPDMKTEMKFQDMKFIHLMDPVKFWPPGVIKMFFEFSKVIVEWISICVLIFIETYQEDQILVLFGQTLENLSYMTSGQFPTTFRSIYGTLMHSEPNGSV